MKGVPGARFERSLPTRGLWEGADGPDVGRAWVVAWLAFVALGIGIGVRTSFGLLIAVWEGGIDHQGTPLQWTRTETAAAAAVGFLVFGMAQPIVGGIADRRGPRLVFATSIVLIGAGTAALAFVSSLAELYLVFSLVMSVGIAGASMVTATVALSRWFRLRKATAAGLVIAGGATGQLVIVPVLAILIQGWGWRAGLLILSLPLLGFAGLLAVFLRDAPRGEVRPQVQPLPAIRAGSPHEAFWLLSGSFAISGLVTTGFIETHLILLAHDRGIPLAVGATAVGVLGLFNVVGTFAAGWAADRIGRVNVLLLVYSTRAVTLLMLLFAADIVGLYAFAIVFGFVNFAAVPSMSALTTDVFGNEIGGRVFGWVAFSHQVGSAAGAYGGAVAHALYDSYTPAVITALALSVAGVLMVGLARRRIASEAVRERSPRVPLAP